MNDTLDYAELAGLLDRLGYAEEAAEYHGSLCGALCVLSPDEIDPVSLLDAAAAGSPEIEPDSRRALSKLCALTFAELSSTEMGFMPLLPDDDTPLEPRVHALSAWCGGFLFGLSSRRGLNLKAISEEGREIVQDLTQFTQAGLSAEDDQELEETAYAELVEYIRVGAQLLFMELRPRAPDDLEDAAPPTLH